jgi:hypothetical protein
MKAARLLLLMPRWVQPAAAADSLQDLGRLGERQCGGLLDGCGGGGPDLAGGADHLGAEPRYLTIW